MLCQECQKREATVHLTKIINNKKKEIYLCDKCAQNKEELNFGKEGFSFNNLLTGLLNSEFGTDTPNSSLNLNYNKKVEEECENCGLNYAEFSRQGKLGCSECYIEFENRINKLLKKIHGNNRHTGKVPKRTGGVIRTRKEIQQLREKMQDAVQKEEFEEAAKLRDAIKELEEEIDE
ncbi:UvrB/UvrC motif-containing protein [Sporohalobacter salinus]|uniref:UvrB/UvrC motif-containing protein n=1 Tax=Sporohalobacter salinus TaxID=1494606 RepID=UPI00195FCA60|nr:UvrB/UvrC motif-containing protein [Sporohalobacter salinus]MBM7624991.1 protein arginine kinase activator [Sporohalobacter salinus]